jgi:hypothetical protein
MASDDDGVWAAAQTIRPHLIDLIGQDAAGPLDRQIAGQLNRAANQPKAVAAMRALLEANEDTSWFLFEVLQDTPRHRPPYLQPRHRLRRGIPSPGGIPARSCTPASTNARVATTSGTGPRSAPLSRSAPPTTSL